MIHIACNIDDNYIMQCCTTLVSVMYNNRNEQITFHIIAEKLSNEAKSMLTEEVEKYNQQIHFYAYNLNMNLSSFKNARDYASIAYLDDSEKADKLFENQLKLLKQPICRNGKNSATVGLEQKVWETWK